MKCPKKKIIYQNEPKFQLNEKLKNEEIKKLTENNLTRQGLILSIELNNIKNLNEKINYNKINELLVDRDINNQKKRDIKKYETKLKALRELYINDIVKREKYMMDLVNHIEIEKNTFFDNVNNNEQKNKEFLGKKVKISKKKKNKKKFHNKNNKYFNNNNIKNRKLEPIENLYQKAKNIYDKKSSPYDLDKIDYTQKVNKDKRWTHDILEKGTFDDKISSLLLYIRQNPKMTIKYIEILIKLAENKNRRKNDAVIIGLKDLFLESILQGKKYLAFNQKYKNLSNNIEKEEEELFNCMIGYFC